MKIHLRQILVPILILLIVFAGIRFTLQSFRVVGASMEPSFYNGQYLLVDKLTYHFRSPRRGEVIVFHNSEEAPSEPYIKRIIGLPGEEVEIKEGKVYINGKPLEESPYIPPTTSQGSTTWTLDTNEYFVLGDNRSHSKDSREGWTVPKEDIVGKVWLRYWPLSKWGLSPKYSATLE